MTSGIQISPWALVLFRGGCTLPIIEKSDSTANQDSVVDIEATNAKSGVEIEFIESAPTDRFVVTNIGSCALEGLTSEINGAIVNITVGDLEVISTKFDGSLAQASLPACLLSNQSSN